MACRITSRWWHGLWLAALCWQAPASARAQSATIAIVAPPRVSKTTLQSVRQTLQDVGDVIDDRAAARLAVWIGFERGKLDLTYRDASSGAMISEQRLPLHGGKLTSAARQKLTAAARGALAQLNHAAPVAPQPAAPGEANDSSEPDTVPSEESVAEASVSAPPPDGAAERLIMRASVGFGAGTRVFHLPTRTFERDLESGFVPALGAGLAISGMVSSQWLLSAEAQYRTLVGLHVAQTSVRSHGVNVSVAPGYRFGPRGSVELRLGLGWGFRGLRPVAPGELGSTSLHGPFVRPELRIPISDGLFTLRIAPEVMVIAGIHTTLPDAEGGFSRAGLGIGGELSLDVRLSEPLYIGIDVRESHVTASSFWNVDLFDVERFALAHVILQY